MAFYKVMGDFICPGYVLVEAPDALTAVINAEHDVGVQHAEMDTSVRDFMSNLAEPAMLDAEEEVHVQPDGNTSE